MKIISMICVCASFHHFEMFRFPFFISLDFGGFLFLGEEPCTAKDQFGGSWGHQTDPKQMHFRFRIVFTSNLLSNSLLAHFDFTVELTSISYRFHFRNELGCN